jgi:hypothetical protein
VPVGENFSTRPFRWSTTYTMPVVSSATPHGSLNCPSALPLAPHARTQAPAVVNFCMRQPFLSAA